MTNVDSIIKLAEANRLIQEVRLTLLVTGYTEEYSALTEACDIIFTVADDLEK